jgi:hypothetical protein
MKKSDERV